MLGPVLFILYLNDLLNLKFNRSIISFADDTALFVEATSWIEVENKLQKDLQNMVHWFDENLLTINLEKTVYLLFSNFKTNIPQNNSIHIELPFRKSSWSLNKTSHVK